MKKINRRVAIFVIAFIVGIALQVGFYMYANSDSEIESINEEIITLEKEKTIDKSVYLEYKKVYEGKVWKINCLKIKGELILNNIDKEVECYNTVDMNFFRTTNIRLVKMELGL